MTTLHVQRGCHSDGRHCTERVVKRKGATENARPGSGRPQKNRGPDNAGPDIAGPIRRVGEMQDLSTADQILAPDDAGPDIDGSNRRGWKMQDLTMSDQYPTTNAPPDITLNAEMMCFS